MTCERRRLCGGGFDDRVQAYHAVDEGGQVKKNFVVFYSPGTFVSEQSEVEIEKWDVQKAKEIAKDIKERHGATPYGFKFIVRSRTEKDLDSRQSKSSGMFFLGGKILTLKQVISRKDSKDEILISNMKSNGIKKIIENRNSYLSTLPFNKGDKVIAWP